MNLLQEEGGGSRKLFEWGGILGLPGRLKESIHFMDPDQRCLTSKKLCFYNFEIAVLHIMTVSDCKS